MQQEKPITKSEPKYPPSERFASWLNAGRGRAEYFSKADPVLVPTTISKMKNGVVPISFELACRIERAQKPTDDPLRAEEIASYIEDRTLIAFMRSTTPQI